MAKYEKIMNQEEFDALENHEKYYYMGAKKGLLDLARIELKHTVELKNSDSETLKNLYTVAVERVDVIQKDHDQYMVMMNAYIADKNSKK